MAGRQGQAALSAHRSAEGRLHARGRRDVQRVRHRTFDSADRGQGQRDRGGYLRALPGRLGARDRADLQEDRAARGGQSGRYRPLHDRVLQAGSAGQGSQQDRNGPSAQQFRAAGRARLQTRGQRPTRNPHRRLDPAIRVRQRASDIHMEPKRDQGVVRFRIDGVLHQVYTGCRPA